MNDQNINSHPFEKCVDWPRLLELRRKWTQEGKTVVWTNGCFDLIHAGHVRSLLAAKRLGDVLVVGINSDASVNRIKGPTRPLMPQRQRAEVLAAFECVDAVVVFDEPTPEASLEKLKPEIHCKGSDYAPPHGKPVPEARIVQSYGGRIEYLPMVEGISTTELVRRIQKMVQ
jgi:D-glycero-beta-D-manno-heptose 1-phosphate adenylyltransferase